MLFPYFQPGKMIFRFRYLNTVLPEKIQKKSVFRKYIHTCFREMSRGFPVRMDGPVNSYL
jgi:hypothetical protein